MRALPLLALAALVLAPAARVSAQVRTDTTAGRAGDSTLTVAPAAERAARTPAARQVLAFERALGTAYVRRDSAALLKLFAPDYREFAPDGRIRGRAEAAAAAATDTMGIAAATLDTATMSVQGDVAVVLGVVTLRGAGDRGELGELHYADTWVRRGGRWQLAASQGELRPAGANAMGYAPSGQGPSGMDVQALASRLQQAERTLHQAFVQRDSATMARLEPHDAVITNPDGTTISGAEDVRSTLAGETMIQSSSQDSVQVIPLGAAAAVVISRVHLAGHARSPSGATQNLNGDFRYQDVWQQRNGEWQMVAQQITPIGSSTPAQGSQPTPGR
ncbi:MAG TPA: nuclear transport factor 2 family protein [Gemmatimonadales bacterium]|nr:nuclear transport factor 2 family protein [Gemmatimonadales bacterium]